MRLSCPNLTDTGVSHAEYASPSGTTDKEVFRVLNESKLHLNWLSRLVAEVLNCYLVFDQHSTPLPNRILDRHTLPELLKIIINSMEY